MEECASASRGLEEKDGSVIPIPWAELEDVLILKPSSLGDIVHALPSAAYLKQAHPHLRLRWLANTEWMPLLEGNPHLEEGIEFPRGEFRGLAGVAKFHRWLRREGQLKARVALDFQGLFRSGYIARASGARWRIGLSDSREGARCFHSHVVSAGPGLHAVDRYLGLLSALGVPTSGQREFWLPEGSPPAAGLPRKFLALHPFSRGEGKSLSAEQVSAFCQAYPGEVVLLGRCEAALAEGLRLSARTVNLLNRTSLAELIHCLRKAAFTVSVDSGPMHIATALSDRVLSLHGWSDPRLVGPYSGRAWVWQNGQIQRREEITATTNASSLEQVNMLELVDFVAGVVA